MAPQAPRRITRYWHEHARAYDEHQLSLLHMGPARDAWAAVWRAALPEAPAYVLDIATGTGQVALLLAQLGHRVVGIDLAEGMLDLARGKCAGMADAPVLMTGDAVAPQFAPASFDAVVSRYLLWTLREPQRALASWLSLLRPGGTVVAIDGFWFAEGLACEAAKRADYADFGRLYDASVVAALPFAELSAAGPLAGAFQDAGFEDVRATPLPEIDRLERGSLPDSDETRSQFMISARRPG